VFGFTRNILSAYPSYDFKVDMMFLIEISEMARRNIISSVYSAISSHKQTIKDQRKK
jgi:hypothetical protein